MLEPFWLISCRTCQMLTSPLDKACSVFGRPYGTRPVTRRADLESRGYHDWQNSERSASLLFNEVRFGVVINRGVPMSWDTL
jgi:hypothetical protein